MQRPAIPLAIVVVVFVAHFGGIITSYDSRWSIPTARSILHEGNTDLDEYRGRLEADPGGRYAVDRIRGRYYALSPIGVSLLALPVVLVIDATGARVPDGKTEKLVASLVTALTALVIYGIARRTLGVPRALLLTFVFAFCTPAWSVAARGLWQHGPSMLMLSLALWLMLEADRRPSIVQYASLPLAFAFVVRPTNAIPIAALTLVVLVKHRRYFVRYVLWAMTIAVPFLLFNLVVYGTWHSWYYSPGRVGHAALLWGALAGNLVSPNRGLFVFSPILLLALYGMWLKLRRDPTLLDGALVVVVLLHWLVISSHLPWDGGHTYGNRLFADVIPYFIYFLIPVVAALPDPRHVAARPTLTAAFVVLVAISFGIHYRGAYRRVAWDWNSTPVDIDVDPTRIWDWRDLQFLRGGPRRG
jgi:Dolichyl-phosphate-mannose-protein mannosyltransferase